MLPRKSLVTMIFCAAFALGAAAVDGAWAQQTGRAQSTSKAPAKKKAPRKAAKAAPAETGKADTAAVQKKLDAAASALAANKADDALRNANDVLTAGSGGPSFVARALYLRGQAYRKQGKPAQAMADFSSALWIKRGLSDADRAGATTARSEAAREAGVTDLPGASGPPTLTAGPAPAVRPAPSATTSGWQTGTATRARTAAPSPPAPAPSNNGIGDFFSGLFGGGNSTPAPAAPSRTAEPAIGQSWSSGTQVKKGK